MPSKIGQARWFVWNANSNLDTLTSHANKTGKYIAKNAAVHQADAGKVITTSQTGYIDEGENENRAPPWTTGSSLTQFAFICSTRYPIAVPWAFLLRICNFQAWSMKRCEQNTLKNHWWISGWKPTWRRAPPWTTGSFSVKDATWFLPQKKLPETLTPSFLHAFG